MPKLLPAAVRIPVPGDKRIDEHLGRLATGDEAVSVATMSAPPGWTEPAQRPTFREITVVLDGVLEVATDEGVLRVGAGQTIVAEPGERVRYATGPHVGAEYVAVCLPAFSEQGARREDGPSATGAQA
jgi:quercetin dioxygenase-like cupin family protein